MIHKNENVVLIFSVTPHIKGLDNMYKVDVKSAQHVQVIPNTFGTIALYAGHDQIIIVLPISVKHIIPTCRCVAMGKKAPFWRYTSLEYYVNSNHVQNGQYIVTTHTSHTYRACWYQVGYM